MNTNGSNRKAHLTAEERIEIQECLSHGMSFKAIGKRLHKDQTTVSREVKRRISITITTVKRVDKDGKPVSALCPKLLKPPFVCNPCPRAHSACSFDRHIYRAKQAQKEYETVLSESREGIPLNKEEFYAVDRIITDGISQGQHLYHILRTNNLAVSVSTVYRHLKKGYLSVSAIDFPRVVKFKPRKGKPLEHVPKALKIGRTHDDFQAYIRENDISTWVEMDTVIGRIGGNAILTFDFIFCNFMFGLLIDNKTAAETAAKILRLKARLRENNQSFGALFPLVLTDNGGEFSDVFSVENTLDGNRETRLFFCDPYMSSQKPHVEKTHTLFRDIVPKDSSFDGFTQDTVNTVFSHVNAVKRKALNGKSPYEFFCFAFGNDIAALLGISCIPPQTVVQSPKLLHLLGVKA
jgi:IS30 family transposase